MTDPAALDAAVRCHLPRIRYEVQSSIPSFETLDLVLIAYRRIVSERDAALAGHRHAVWLATN